MEKNSAGQESMESVLRVKESLWLEKNCRHGPVDRETDAGGAELRGDCVSETVRDEAGGMDGGKKVWVAHALDGYKLGRIVDIGVDGLTVELVERPPGQRLSAPFDSTFPADEYDHKDVDDNCTYILSTNKLRLGLLNNTDRVGSKVA